MAVTAGFVVTQATTLLLIVLGAFVLAVRPRTRATIAFAIYAIAAGAGLFTGNLWQLSLQTPTTTRVALVLYLIAGAALVILLSTFSRKAGPRAQLALWGGTLAVFGFSVLVRAALRQRTIVEQLGANPAAIQAPLAVGAVYLAWRFGSESDARMRSQLALVSAGLIPYVAMSVGDSLVRFDQYWDATPHALLLVAATAYWLWNTRGPAPSGTSARNVALLIPSTVLVGMAARAWIGEGNIDETGLYGIARILAFSILGYAILRHQLLGIDVKVRFAISKSTIAAAFIAVFFIASEMAQQFFGEQFESGYLGILAAGALVFAIAPLSRMADRFAEKAVPVTIPPTPIPAGGANDDLYRRALRIALRDRWLTREEDLTLAELSERLHIGHKRALELRHEIERERAGDPQEADA